MSFRIGHGYDVHRLVVGRPLIIGGVKIDHPTGLDGHSDADVLSHAVSDSLLGALCLGDIGKHFPDTDPSFKDADSIILLKKCIAKMHYMGYTLCNIDATVIAQSPKLAPYIDRMRSNISSAFGCEIDQINIKATTEEKLGFTGDLSGISAHCICLISKE